MAEGAETTVTLEARPEPQAEAAPRPARAELEKGGWSPKEIEAAEKRGMVAKPGEEKRPEAGKPEAEGGAKPEGGEKGKEGEAEAKKPEARAPGILPDFSMTPEQERVFAETFGKGTAPRAMYFRMKNERHARQAAEARIREMEAEGRGRAQAQEPAPEVSDEDRPLTLKDLKEHQRREAEEIEARRAAQSERGSTLVAAQTEQEDYARSIHPDFDDTVTKAQEVIKNLDALVPEKWRQAKAIQLVRQLQVAAANADKLGLDEYHAALIAYEIGQLHPEYGKAKEAGPKDGGSPKDAPKTGVSPETLARIEKNTQRRQPSAAVPAGGGKRTVSVEDVDLPTLNGMTYAERRAFREKHPDRYAKLVRG